MLSWPVLRSPADVDAAWSQLEQIDRWFVAKRVEFPPSTGAPAPPPITRSIRKLVRFRIDGASRCDLLPPNPSRRGLVADTVPLWPPDPDDPHFPPDMPPDVSCAPEFWSNRNGLDALRRRRRTSSTRQLRRQITGLAQHIDQVLFPPLVELLWQLEDDYVRQTTAYEAALRSWQETQTAAPPKTPKPKRGPSWH